ncbi:MAG: YHS domain-containing protein [Bacteroidetes bacterium]|nr:YHS domain-containing protein [Bacteroidota bacterium]
MVKDPVCGMTIREEDAAGSITYKGVKYYFCAPVCKVTFLHEPKKYALQNTSGAKSKKQKDNVSHNGKDVKNEND